MVQRSINLLKKPAFALNACQSGLLLQIMTQIELLDRLETDLRDLLEIARAQIAERPLDALQARREPGTWNALECVAHLNAFLEMYLPRLERAIHLSKARRWQPGDDIRSTWMGRRVIKFADLAYFKPRKSAKRYNFFDKFLGKEAVKTFIINSERLLRNIQAAREVDLNKAKIEWGASGFFKLTLGNTLEWLVLHGQRHIKQATDTLNITAQQKASPTPNI